MKKTFVYAIKQGAGDDIPMLKRRMACAKQYACGKHDKCEEFFPGNCHAIHDKEGVIHKPLLPYGRYFVDGLPSAVEAAWEHVTTDAMLQQCIHPYSTQANEACNQSFTNCEMPKSRCVYNGNPVANFRAAFFALRHNAGFNGLLLAQEKSCCAVTNDQYAMAKVIEHRKNIKKAYSRSKQGKIRRKHKSDAKTMQQVREEVTELKNPTYVAGGFGSSSSGRCDSGGVLSANMVEVAAGIPKQGRQCSNCLRRSVPPHTASRCVKEKHYSREGPKKKKRWPILTMTLKVGDIAFVWDLETTGLSVYYEEPVEIGYSVLRVVGNENGVLLFEKVGNTYSSLTKTNQKISEAALATHAITASIVEEQGVNLQAACDTLKDWVVAAKNDGSTRVFGIGYNSDSFDMRMMQYSSARHFKRENTHRDLAWYNFLKEMGVVGTIDLQRVLSSSMVIDGLNGKTSQVNAFKLDVGRDMTGAHRAAADVDGLVQILCDSRMSL